MTPLKRLEELLLQLNFPAYLAPQDEDIPFEHLLVALDEGEYEVPKYILKAFILEDLVNAGFEQEGPTNIATQAETAQSFATLHLNLSLDITVPPAKLLDTFRLMTSFSQLVPHGFFGVSESELNQGIFYSHTLLSQDQAFKIGPLIEILSQAQFFINRLMPKAIEFISTKKPLELILEEIGQVLASAAQSDG